MASSSSASSNSPCAACKFLRRKCTQTCVFAPFFPPDQPAKFANVHRVFGASNVSKLLNELPTIHREDAVNSLAFEAEARLRDPVYGCVGCISTLQNKLRKLQEDLLNARKELAGYIGVASVAPPFLGQVSPAALADHHHHHQSNQTQQLILPAFRGSPAAMMSPAMGIGLPNAGPQTHSVAREHQQQHLLETVQLMNAARDQELLRGYDHHQHQQQQQQNQQPQLEFARYAGVYDGGGSGGEGSTGLNHLAAAGVLTVAEPSSDLALVPQSFGNSFQVQPQQQEQHHLHLHLHHHRQQQEEEEQRRRRRTENDNDKDMSSAGSAMGTSSYGSTSPDHVAGRSGHVSWVLLLLILHRTGTEEEERRKKAINQIDFD